MSKKLHIVGELMNNSYARARKAFNARDPKGYGELAKLQSDLGAEYLTLNIDGTQRIQVRQKEMFDFLPDVIPAIQEATSTPIAFDNPNVEYHKIALAHYDRKKSGPPILNSLAASRDRLDEMVELVKHYDTLAVVMASETFVPGGTSQCLNPQDSYRAAKHFVELLVTKAGRTQRSDHHRPRFGAGGRGYIWPGEYWARCDAADQRRSGFERRAHDCGPIELCVGHAERGSR